MKLRSIFRTIPILKRIYPSLFFKFTQLFNKNVFLIKFKDVYLNLEPLHLLSYANHMYNNLERVKFLTAIPHSWWDTQEGEQAMINKRLWLERYIDNFSYEDVIFTAGAKDKIKYVEENAVLYDDRQDTIDAWNEAGGTGIHVKGR